MNNLRFPLAGALALAATIFCALIFVPAVVAQPAKPALRIHETRFVSLPGNTPRFTQSSTDLGTIEPETRLEQMLLLLKPNPSRETELDKLLEAQQQPGSAAYHRWLTPDEFGARFGTDAAALARITAWLEQHGLTVNEQAPSRRLLFFSGTAAQVEEAFHTPIHRYRAAAAQRISNVRDPEIPAALASAITGIVSLHNQRRHPMLQIRKRPAAMPQWNLYGSHYLYPGDLAAIYNIAPLYAAGTTGTDQRIAIVGRSNINLTDVAAFRTAAALPANPPQIILPGPNPDTDPGLIPGDQDEATLDVEWAGAIAPAAKVTLVSQASTATTDGVDLAAAYIVNHAIAPIVSVSFGQCEAEMGATELAFYNTLWKQAAAQGMSVFVSSGDSGAAGCETGSAAQGSRPAVNGLCTSPYATCVGGTQLEEAGNPGQYWSTANGTGNVSARGYIPEKAWNESASEGGNGLWATGGGISAIYAQPAWQANTNGAEAANGMRAAPDVSLTAAAHDGYVIHENGSDWIVSGTSASAPAFAAIMALVNQRQGAPQGNANPRLYTLAAQENIFHPTPSGANTVPGVPGFSATGETYNLATGLGSVDATALAAHWSAHPPKPIATPQPWKDLPGAHGGPLQTVVPLSFAKPR